MTQSFTEQQGDKGKCFVIAMKKVFAMGTI